MRCHRCRGLLVKDQSVVESLSDLSEVTGCMGLTMRCINCGYLEDPVVRVNSFLLLWQLSRRSCAWRA
jgi:hypothetical protein